MKIAHIMLFMLLLNISIVAINSMGIYQFDAHPELIIDDFDIGSLEDAGAETAFHSFIPFFTVVGLLSGLVIGGVAHWGSGVPADKAFVYSFFMGAFVGTIMDTFSLASRIASYNTGIGYIMYIFVGISGVLFIMGVLQMVVGGWKSFL